MLPSACADIAHGGPIRPAERFSAKSCGGAASGAGISLLRSWGPPSVVALHFSDRHIRDQSLVTEPTSADARFKAVASFDMPAFTQATPLAVFRQEVFRLMQNCR